MRRQIATKRWIMRELLRIAEEQGYSIPRIARETRIAQNVLYRWKWGGVDDCRWSTIERLADFLGYEVDLVMKRELQRAEHANRK